MFIGDAKAMSQVIY